MNSPNARTDTIAEIPCSGLGGLWYTFLKLEATTLALIAELCFGLAVSPGFDRNPDGRELTGGDIT